MSARKMKDSGIEWIGEIPEEWEISKVSYFYKISLGKMLQPNAKEESDTLENYLCALNVFWNKITTDNIKQMWFAKSEKKQYELTAGDLIVTEGGDVAAACIWEGEVNPCYIQNAVYRVRSLPGFLNKYLYYHLFVAKTTGYIDMLCNKATIAHFTKDKFSNLPFIVLPLDEQQKIVAHLDEKCGEIDKVVVSKQKQNEQLAAYRQSLVTEAVTKGLNPAAPMKDSDIEWIGEIPEHWDICRLKYYAKINNGRDYKEIVDENGNYPVIGSGGQFANAKQYLYNRPSVLLGRKGTIDKPMFVDYPFWTVDTMFYTEINEGHDSKFFYYLCLTIRFDYYQYGSAVPSMTQKDLSESIFTLPPLSEQKSIAAYLDKKCGEIDALSEHNKNIIESLQEYKQSLIYEAVTGKIEL